MVELYVRYIRPVPWYIPFKLNSNPPLPPMEYVFTSPVRGDDTPIPPSAPVAVPPAPKPPSLYILGT